MLKNQNEGTPGTSSALAQKSFRQGFLKAAYSYSQSRNTVDPGSIALGSWTGNQISGDPTTRRVAYSSQCPGQRVFVAGTYRFEYLKFGATTFSFFLAGLHAGNASYTLPRRPERRRRHGNDLIYVPRDQSEMNFQPFTAGGRTTRPPSRPRPGTPTSARTAT